MIGQFYCRRGLNARDTLGRRALAWLVSLPESERLELWCLLADIQTPGGIVRDWIQEHGGVRVFATQVRARRAEEMAHAG